MPENMPVLDAAFFANLCQATYRPLLIDGILRGWLLRHFANADRIQRPGLAQRIWKATDDTGIDIVLIDDWKPNTMNKRPQIVIRWDDLTPKRDGIDNRFVSTGPVLVRATPQLYANTMLGSHTLFCIAGESAECKELAFEVYDQLMKFAPTVQKLLNLSRMELAKIDRPGRLEESSENFAAPITLAYAYGQQWLVEPLDEPALKEILLTFGTA